MPVAVRLRPSGEPTHDPAPVDHHKTMPMMAPMASATMSLSETVRGGKKICANSIATLRRRKRTGPIPRPASRRPAGDAPIGRRARVGERHEKQDVGDPVGSRADAKLQVGNALERLPGIAQRMWTKIERDEAAIDHENRITEGEDHPPQQIPARRARNHGAYHGAWRRVPGRQSKACAGSSLTGIGDPIPVSVGPTS